MAGSSIKQRVSAHLPSPNELSTASNVLCCDELARSCLASGPDHAATGDLPQAGAKTRTFVAMAFLFPAARARAAPARARPWDMQSDLLPEDWRPIVEHLRADAQAQQLPMFDVADVFSGRGGIAKAMQEEGLRVIRYDITLDARRHDITTDAGLDDLLASLVRVPFGGLAWFAPPCSSWVWLSRGTYDRSVANPAGDTSQARVRAANRIAELTAKVTKVCDALGIHWVLEQPRASLMLRFGPIAEVVQAAGVTRVAVELGRVGADSVKPLTLHGTAPWLGAVRRQIRALPRAVGLQTLSSRSGGRTAALRRSAAYPSRFCTIVASAHRALLRRRIRPEIAGAGSVVESVDELAPPTDGTASAGAVAKVDAEPTFGVDGAAEAEIIVEVEDEPAPQALSLIHI